MNLCQRQRGEICAVFFSWCLEQRIFQNRFSGRVLSFGRILLILLIYIPEKNHKRKKKKYIKGLGGNRSSPESGPMAEKSLFYWLFDAAEALLSGRFFLSVDFYGP